MPDNLEELERLLKGPAWLVQLGEWTAKHGNTLIATAREVEGLRSACDLWDWLGANKNIELRHSRWDDEVYQWEVYSVNGGRNDQEWTLRGTGETPFEAIKAARAALEGKGGLTLLGHPA